MRVAALNSMRVSLAPDGEDGCFASDGTAARWRPLEPPGNRRRCKAVVLL